PVNSPCPEKTLIVPDFGEGPSVAQTSSDPRAAGTRAIGFVRGNRGPWGGRRPEALTEPWAAKLCLASFGEPGWPSNKDCTINADCPDSHRVRGSWAKSVVGLVRGRIGRVCQRNSLSDLVFRWVALR